MLDVKYDRRQIRDIGKRLDYFADQIKDMRRANKQVEIQLYAWCINNFDREGAFVGGWPPLAESTIREKERLGKQRMLVRSGLLRGGFSGKSSKTDASIGNDVEYSVYHHSAEARRGRLPRRQLLPSAGTVLEIGLTVYQLYIGRAVKKANGK